jgi:uncharacterized protein YodC (DUF2158 family)
MGEPKDGHVECLWFDVNRNLHRETFPVEVLKKFK